jgi:DtxR family Mn-dependent transcriptional regulator
MSTSDLSSSAQDYLKAIWNLQEWSDSPVTASVISERVGLKLSSVSDAVRRLTEQGLLEHAPYGRVELTAAGRAHAVAMVRRHRLIETFLVRTLAYSWHEVHDEAERLEHAVSDLMVDRIDELLGHPTRDPHGDPIPSPDGTTHRPEAIPLVAEVPGASVRVARISDSDPELLKYFAAEGVVMDAELDIIPGDPYSGAIVVRVAGRPNSITLGAAAASAVWVSR